MVVVEHPEDAQQDDRDVSDIESPRRISGLVRTSPDSCRMLTTADMVAPYPAARGRGCQGAPRTS